MTWEPGVSRTRAWRDPVRRLKSADLPTLGLPRRTTTGRGGVEVFSADDGDGNRRCFLLFLLPPPLLLPAEIEAAAKKRNGTTLPLLLLLLLLLERRAREEAAARQEARSIFFFTRAALLFFPPQRLEVKREKRGCRAEKKSHSESLSSSPTFDKKALGAAPPLASSLFFIFSPAPTARSRLSFSFEGGKGKTKA